MIQIVDSDAHQLVGPQELRRQVAHRGRPSIEHSRLVDYDYLNWNYQCPWCLVSPHLLSTYSSAKNLTLMAGSTLTRDWRKANVLAQDAGASLPPEGIKEEECAHYESAGLQSWVLKEGACSEGRATESTKVAVPAAACDRAPLFLNSPTILDNTANLILYSPL
jgi:hypothetical protein